MSQLHPSSTETAGLEEETLEPRLDALTGAILDGSPVDWSSPDASVELSPEFQIIADVAGLHRSLPDDSSALSELTQSLPRRAGALVLTQSVGRGTFGEVFRAWDTRLHRDVAVKLLFQQPNPATNQTALDEGRLLARVRHPHVVTVLGVEQIDGRVALVTEYLEGESLARILSRSGPLDESSVIAIGKDLCDALQAVHDAGLVHCDVKPQNVMREPNGRIVLADFGAGQRESAVHRRIAGTPLYLAPELLDGSAPSVASDIYSLGVLLQYAATGTYPVTGRSLDDMRKAHASRRYSPRSGPASLTGVLSKSTAPAASDRFRTARELRTALSELEGNRAWSARMLLPLAALALLTIGLVWLTGKLAQPLHRDLAGVSAEAVPLPPYRYVGGPSADGRFFVYIDAKNVVQRVALTTGHVAAVASGAPGEGRPVAAILSADGISAAVAWEKPRSASPSEDTRPSGVTPAKELRIYRAGTAWPQDLFESTWTGTILDVAEGGVIFPLAWTASADAVLALVHQPDGLVQLVLAFTDGRDRRVVRNFNGVFPHRATMSPDGRFVAYDYPADGREGQRDIMIVATASDGEPHALLADPSNEDAAVWTPSGDGLTFRSDRDGDLSGWYVPMSEGRAVASPRKLWTNSGGTLPIAMTASGDLYYHLRTKAPHLELTPLDADGRVADKPTIVHLPSLYAVRQPTWSPNGGVVALVASRGRNIEDDFPSILLLEPATGQARGIEPSLVLFGTAPMKWSPDGRRLLVRGKGPEGYWGYHAVDVETGTTRPIFRAERRGSESGLGAAVDWGFDEDTIFYSRPGVGVVERNLLSGRERLIMPADEVDWISGLGADHANRRLAFSRWNEKSRQSALYLWSPGQNVSVVLAREGGRPVAFRAWSTDGRILVTLATPQGRRPAFITPDGSETVESGLTLAMSGSDSLTLSPDSRLLAYTQGQESWEVRVMRHVMR